MISFTTVVFPDALPPATQIKTGFIPKSLPGILLYKKINNK